jgi:predicted secreted hydrolase
VKAALWVMALLLWHGHLWPSPRLRWPGGGLATPASNGRPLALRASPSRRGPPPTFRLSLPGYHWRFPQDDFAHPAFANEWWYFTGNLRSAQGRAYGFELTFFRISPFPGATLRQDLYFTHFTVTDVAGRRFQLGTRARRGLWQQAGLAREAAGGFEIFNENWRARFGRNGPIQLHAAWGVKPRMSLDLRLAPGPRMLNGVNGWSQKGGAPGQASYYYSFPHIRASGAIDGHAVTGLAWMDHEFASDQLSPRQQGWDWMGLHLPEGDLMLFNLRRVNGQRDPHSAGTFLPRNGPAAPLDAADFSLTPLRQWHGYPVAWRIAVPKLGLKATVTAALDDQLVRDPSIGVTYWEGAVNVRGAMRGRPLTGKGYLELTGYGHRFTLLQ